MTKHCELLKSQRFSFFKTNWQWISLKGRAHCQTVEMHAFYHETFIFLSWADSMPTSQDYRFCKIANFSCKLCDIAVSKFVSLSLFNY